ncbi:hypothetical protein [Paenarthrobacter nicotinovorans]|uniref:hypothetical protein n=1 Tax=Paenarthrobacter nicotinovorans TaxID=29320 RepID=UPI0012DD6C7A|nr:hypothetical protein [Paenarthrobacter nicotinovorans]
MTETLEQLGQLGLPEDIAVYRVGGTVQRVVVGTAKDGAGRLDLESFQAGVAVITGLLGSDYPNQASESDDVRQELNVLRSKHLSLLEVLIPKGQEAVEAPVVKPEDMRKLEDDMFRLERRYEGLDSTYLALQSTYAALDSDYQAMEASYQALETKHVALESSYQAVKASYQALEAKHAALDSSHQALETKYAGLDSRYRALANSRLGKITLRMWERKTSRNKKMQLKEEN